MSNTFGLQNWRFFQNSSQQSSQQSNQLTEMIPLQRLESEIPPNVLTGKHVFMEAHLLRTDRVIHSNC